MENIHKVINPLFLDDLTTKLHDLENRDFHDSVGRDLQAKRIKAYRKYREDLGNLRFLDPACGSGNFLTETYISLRRLENEALRHEKAGQGEMSLGGGLDDPVLVSLDQFYGIEINGFACAVARTALWIAEQQSYDITESILQGRLPRLPLEDTGHIVQANALRYDWNELLPANECSYVMGNPPFVGQYTKSHDQTADMRAACGDRWNGYLDYAAGWYFKAADYLSDGEDKRFAFVSTNSLTQGQPVAALFRPLFSEGWSIEFAHQTFEWKAQSTDTAHVFVVVIGMTNAKSHACRLYSYETPSSEPRLSTPEYINAYLLPADDCFVSKRTSPLAVDLDSVNRGSEPTDGGNLLIEDVETYNRAIEDDIAKKYVRKLVGAKELINGIDRWCLWLVEATPSDMRQSAFIRERVDKVKKFREASKSKATVEASKTPWLFEGNRQPEGDYLAIPRVFSGRREYATCDWYSPEIIAGDEIYTCDDPDGFNFAVMESSMFITWQKAIGGRLKSDCRFSNTIVWNNLPLPRLSDELRQEIIEAGHGVIDVRAQHEGQSLADLYDPDFMPADLRKAHQRLDKVVDAAFGAPKYLGDGEAADNARLDLLFGNYRRLTE